MLNSLEQEFRKAFYLINLKGFGHFKKLGEERRLKKYQELKKKIQDDKKKIEDLKKNMESAQDAKDKQKLKEMLDKLNKDLTLETKGVFETVEDKKLSPEERTWKQDSSFIIQAKSRCKYIKKLESVVGRAR